MPQAGVVAIREAGARCQDLSLLQKE